MLGHADLALFAPLGRDNLPADARLDLAAMVATLNAVGCSAKQMESVDAILEELGAGRECK
jgi:hypothetical protein